jgi:metallo-beta-lactamase family protein
VIPKKIAEADWLVLESTYGDKDHGNIADRGKMLLQIMLETLERDGNVVIPEVGQSFRLGGAVSGGS